MVASIRADVFRRGLTLRWWLDWGRICSSTDGRLFKIDHQGCDTINRQKFKLRHYSQSFEKQSHTFLGSPTPARLRALTLGQHAGAGRASNFIQTQERGPD